MKYYKYISALFISLALFSCSKDDEDKKAEEPVKDLISIYSPSENQIFKNGDTLNIHAKISSSTKLHGYEITVMENLDTLFSKDEHWHGFEIDLQEKWKIEVDSTTTLKVEVRVTLDHDGNEAAKDINIVVNN